MSRRPPPPPPSDKALQGLANHRHHRPASEPAPSTRETSIVAALRARLAAKDDEVKRLRMQLREHESTIALLYGQLDSRT